MTNRSSSASRENQASKRPAEAGLGCYNSEGSLLLVILPPLIALRIGGPCFCGIRGDNLVLRIPNLMQHSSPPYRLSEVPQQNWLGGVQLEGLATRTACCLSESGPPSSLRRTHDHHTPERLACQIPTTVDEGSSAVAIKPHVPGRQATTQPLEAALALL